MQQWDYKLVHESNLKLKELGEQGWELVAVQEQLFYFKRPIPIIIGPITIGSFEAENEPQPPQDSTAWPGAIKTNVVRWFPSLNDLGGIWR